jgi:hypothetical protein
MVSCWSATNKGELLVSDQQRRDCWSAPPTKAKVIVSCWSATDKGEGYGKLLVSDQPKAKRPTKVKSCWSATNKGEVVGQHRQRRSGQQRRIEREKQIKGGSRKDKENLPEGINPT